MVEFSESDVSLGPIEGDHKPLSSVFGGVARCESGFDAASDTRVRRTSQGREVAFSHCQIEMTLQRTDQHYGSKVIIDNQSRSTVKQIPIAHTLFC